MDLWYKTIFSHYLKSQFAKKEKSNHPRWARLRDVRHLKFKFRCFNPKFGQRHCPEIPFWPVCINYPKSVSRLPKSPWIEIRVNRGKWRTWTAIRFFYYFPCIRVQNVNDNVPIYRKGVKLFISSPHNFV
jgi:hypothetical protein